jgi:alpha-glucosidase
MEMTASRMYRLLPTLSFWLVAVLANAVQGERLGIQRQRFEAGERYLVVEILDDDLAHFELSEVPTGPDPVGGIYVTPMVDRGSYSQYLGPHRDGFSVTEQVIETSELKITVAVGSLCVSIFDKARGVSLTRICGEELKQGTKRLLIDRGEMQNVYGVGNLFYDPRTADGDWIDRVWNGRNHGNFRFGFHVTDTGVGWDDFHGGGPSVSQFPMIYAVGRELGPDGVQNFQNYGLFLDQVYRMSWDFRGAQWTVRTWGDQLRWFVFTGPNLKDLRGDFLELVGRPPVPPRATFGLWISEFGYDNWNEIRHDLDSLRANRFPVDGVALDIQWFGGSFDGNENDGNCEPNRMGTLRFNEANFPSPQTEVPRFLTDYGVRFMPIEESFVDNRLPEHTALWGRKYLARVSDVEPVTVTRDFRHEGRDDHCVWWGSGGMIDWSNPEAGRFWHQDKRLALGRMGITSHWLDLGEPEMYYEHAIYHGFPELGKNRHGDIHNVYNLLWVESIFRGYRDEENGRELRDALGLNAPPRHFTLSRAGTIGSQRYGGMWSGDVARNLGNLRAHLNTQMHMSLAGMDYYTSDAGGFLGTGSEQGYDREELYTQWFANNCLLDIPLRPHAWANDELNSGNIRLAPDQRGHRESNRANLRLRYRLTPYIYSLAYRAWRMGEPIIPPLVVHFQGDANARSVGNVKMIGDSLLFGVVAGFGETDRRVYLPAGRWVDYHSLDWYDSSGAESHSIPTYRDRDGHPALFTIPLFARAGAIIPLMHVDDHTRNLSGRRSIELTALTEEQRQREQILASELSVRVFASPAPSSFTLYEDDGQTLEYLRGRVRQTRISQQSELEQARVMFHAAAGDFHDAPSSRAFAVELITDGKECVAVSLNGLPLPHLASPTDFAAGASGWINAGHNRILARSGIDSVGRDHEFNFQLRDRLPRRSSLHFVCSNGRTLPGEAIFVLGNLPELGQWDPAKAVRLEPVRYETWRRWSRVVDDLPPETDVEWKFIRRLEDGTSVLQWEHDGPNHKARTPPSGFGGTFHGEFR